MFDTVNALTVPNASGKVREIRKIFCRDYTKNDFVFIMTFRRKEL